MTDDRTGELARRRVTRADSRDVARAFGRLPGLLVVGPFLVALGLISLISSGTATAVLACLPLGVLVVHCVARPRRGLDVFCSAAVPGVVATLLHDLAGTPTWIGWVLIPLALGLVAAIDADERAAAAPDEAAQPLAP